MRFRPLLLVAFVASLAPLARVLHAQTPDSTHRAPGATVSGVVRDSVTHAAPLGGAWVQLVAADTLTQFARSVFADSLGRFAIRDVPDGRFALGFIHPMLDSLGVELPPRIVVVSGRRSVRADLAVPAPARLRAAICGPRTSADSSDGAILMGVVREAGSRAPAAGVTVTGDWLEFIYSPGGVERRQPRLMATTAPNGWFAMCDVPTGGTMFVVAGRGADSTDLIELDVPKDGFLRRDLTIGSARMIAAGDATRSDTLALPTRPLRLGDGRLRGTVRAVEGGRPLAGAVVRVTGGQAVRTNDRGEWTLVDAPSGTRMLEVRAIGYFPVHRPVDIIAGAAPVAVALSTLKSVMDTVRVTVARVVDKSHGGFEERRRQGMGHYLTAEQIAKWGYSPTSDLILKLPGVRLDGRGLERRLGLRGKIGDSCAPAMYLDGIYMWDLSVDDIDLMVNPEHVTGMEVYSGLFMPVRFQRVSNTCGAIVIWTK